MDKEETVTKKVSLPVDKEADTRLLNYGRLLHRIRKRVVIEKREDNVRSKWDYNQVY